MASLANTASASLGTALIGWLRNATGAVATTLKKLLGWQRANVFEFMTSAQIADVQGFTYLIDVSAALNAAFLACPDVYLPKGGYLAGSQLTMQTQQLLTGAGRWNAVIKKGFNGDLFASFPSKAGCVDMYFDGNGATYTGRIFPLATAGAGNQYLHRCNVIDANGYCIEFSDKDAGSQFKAIDCTIARYDGTTAGKYAIKITDTQQLSAIPRTFVGIQSNGTYTIDLGGGNNTYISESFLGGLKFTADTRAALITGCRLAGSATTLSIDGQNNAITGCDIFQDLTLLAGCAANAIRANTYNGTVTDNSGAGTNLIDAPSVSYTPTITQAGGGSFAIGNGTLRGEYSRNGDVISLSIELIIGASTTFGTGAFRFSIPMTPQPLSGATQTGVAYLLDNGTTVQAGMAILAAGAAYLELASTGSLTLVGTTAPWTWAVNDAIRINISYLA